MKSVLQMSVFLFGGMLAVWALGGCATSLMGRVPIERSLTLPTSPAEAYVHAAQTFTRFGGHLQVADPHSRLLAGTVHGAVALTVHVDATSTVVVTAALLPGKLVVGSLTEADEYLALLAQEVPHAR